MNWLITGGCGFIGKNLLRHLLSKDENLKIRIVDNFSVGQISDLTYATSNVDVAGVATALDWEKNVQIIEGDITDSPLMELVTKGADVVVHLAANTGVGPSVENPRMDCVTNVLGTFNVLEGCRANGVKRFVFASSGAPIGECTPPIHEELACHPVSPYGASKMAGEGYCSSYFRTFGLGTVALRFGNVYGPGSTHKSSVVAKFIRQGLNGETLEIYGDGTQTRDFIFTEDLVSAIWNAATIKGIGGEVFQIATNKETTVLEVTEKLVDVLKRHGVPNVKLIHGNKRLGDVMRNFSDTTKAEKILKWTYQYDLDKGLNETVNWFLKKIR